MDRRNKNITIVSALILVFYVIVCYYNVTNIPPPQAVIIANEMFMLLSLLLTLCIFLFWIINAVKIKSINPFKYIALINLAAIAIILFMIFYIG